MVLEDPSTSDCRIGGLLIVSQAIKQKGHMLTLSVMPKKVKVKSW